MNSKYLRMGVHVGFIMSKLVFAYSDIKVIHQVLVV